MKFFRFSSLQSVPNLRHSITTRVLETDCAIEGGVSSGEYSSLNLAFHVGDDENLVRENRWRLSGALGYDASTLVVAQQVHGANSQVVTSEYSGRGALDWDSAIPDCDALIVAESKIPLLIQVADCAPVLMVDPARRVLAVVHAGWRGAMAGAASQTIGKMSSEFGTNANEVLCGIGPCLCADCFEIGEEVAAQAPDACVLRDAKWKKPHLDLRALVQEDLRASGVLSSHVEVMDSCTRCESETFFSHRAQGGKAGRFGLVAWWE
jgi:YfiH family protein